MASFLPKKLYTNHFRTSKTFKKYSNNPLPLAKGGTQNIQGEVTCCFFCPSAFRAMRDFKEIHPLGRGRATPNGSMLSHSKATCKGGVG